MKNACLNVAMCDHIGQVRIHEAQGEIDRLESQFPNSKWKMDFTPFLYEYDSTEAGPHETELSEGYCWIVRNH